MIKALLLSLSVWFSAGVLMAQRMPASAARSQSGGVVVPVALGQSVVTLDGPWKFTVGDSPNDPNTGQPLWAEVGFDDSEWERVDLTSNAMAIDPTSG